MKKIIEKNKLENLPKLLIVDDIPENIKALERLLRPIDCEIFRARTGNEALALTLDHEFALILADINMPEMNGYEMMSYLRSEEKTKRVPVIFLTASYTTEEHQFKGYELGAVDFLLKPLNEFVLLQKVKVFLDLYNQRKELELEISQRKKLQSIVELDSQYPDIIGNSPEMKHVFSLMNRVSKTDATVLILGETGTGKELIAKAIHRASSRADNPFICINCAALPETLIESELFGYEKGAFTSAEGTKMGRFELADKGTLFIDEIGELSLTAQVKLLRILQEQKFERVGGTSTISVNVRIIVATNRDLEKLISESKFRDDLYYRLNTFPIVLPPLRTRGSDILLLAEHFLTTFSREFQKKDLTFSSQAKQLLETYTWKGNVRELQNIISRAVLLCDDTVIQPHHLAIKTSYYQDFVQTGTDQMLSEEELNRLYAKSIYQKLQGNKKETAKALNITFKTLNNRLEEK